MRRWVCMCLSLQVLSRFVWREVLTPSLFCPVLASISCRARTDRDCSNTKLQMHRSGGTCCRVEGENSKVVRKKRGQGKVEVDGRDGMLHAQPWNYTSVPHLPKPQNWHNIKVTQCTPHNSEDTEFCDSLRNAAFHPNLIFLPAVCTHFSSICFSVCLYASKRPAERLAVSK